MTLNRFKMLALALTLILAVPAMANAQGVMFVTGGQVGIGTDTPAEKLHVKDGNFKVEQSVAGTAAILAFTTAAQNWDIFQNGNTGRLIFRATGLNNGALKFDPTANTNLLKIGTEAVDEVTITGRLVINGTDVTPDFVFEPGYELESIEEHAESMWTNRHLPAVPSAKDNENGVNVVETQFGVLEELEKAHIYIAQLNESIKQLEAQLTELKK